MQASKEGSIKRGERKENVYLVSLIYLEGGDRIKNLIKVMNTHQLETKQNLRERTMPDVCVRQQPEESR